MFNWWPCRTWVGDVDALRRLSLLSPAFWSLFTTLSMAGPEMVSIYYFVYGRTWAGLYLLLCLWQDLSWSLFTTLSMVGPELVSIYYFVYGRTWAGDVDALRRLSLLSPASWCPLQPSSRSTRPHQPVHCQPSTMRALHAALAVSNTCYSVKQSDLNGWKEDFFHKTTTY